MKQEPKTHRELTTRPCNKVGSTEYPTEGRSLLLKECFFKLYKGLWNSWWMLYLNQLNRGCTSFGGKKKKKICQFRWHQCNIKNVESRKPKTTGAVKQIFSILEEKIYYYPGNNKRLTLLRWTKNKSEYFVHHFWTNYYLIHTGYIYKTWIIQ